MVMRLGNRRKNILQGVSYFMRNVLLGNIWRPTAIAKTVGTKKVPNITLHIKNDTPCSQLSPFFLKTAMYKRYINSIIIIIFFSKPNRDYNYTFVNIDFSVFQATLIRFTPCSFCFLLSYSTDGK